MASTQDTTDVKMLIEEGVKRAAVEVAEMADQATEAILARVEQPTNLGSPKAVKEALFADMCEEILSRIAQEISGHR